MQKKKLCFYCFTMNSNLFYVYVKPGIIYLALRVFNFHTFGVVSKYVFENVSSNFSLRYK